MIPNIFHFILISKDGQTPPSMEYYMYVAIKSAHRTNHPDKVYLYITRGLRPVGPWFERLMGEFPNIILEEVDDIAAIYGNPVVYFTHKTDIIRIQKLIEYGGIYLDLDTITLRDLSEFRHYKFVTSIEDDSWRFGSAVLMSEPGSVFANEMFELYRNFRSRGRDEYFVETIQEQPYQLWKTKYRNSNEVTVITADEILSPKTLMDWKGTQIYFKQFFEEEDSFKLDNRFVLHLWTELNYQRIKDLEFVLSQKTTYSKLIKEFIND